MNFIRSKKRHINIVTSSCIHQSINPTACINFFWKSKCKHNNIKTIFSSGQGNRYFLHYFSRYNPYETFFCIYYTCLWIFVHLSITETLLHRWNSLFFWNCEDYHGYYNYLETLGQLVHSEFFSLSDKGYTNFGWLAVLY